MLEKASSSFDARVARVSRVDISRALQSSGLRNERMYRKASECRRHARREEDKGPLEAVLVPSSRSHEHIKVTMENQGLACERSPIFSRLIVNMHRSRPEWPAATPLWTPAAFFHTRYHLLRVLALVDRPGMAGMKNRPLWRGPSCKPISEIRPNKHWPSPADLSV